MTAESDEVFQAAVRDLFGEDATLEMPTNVLWEDGTPVRYIVTLASLVSPGLPMVKEARARLCFDAKQNYLGTALWHRRHQRLK